MTTKKKEKKEKKEEKEEDNIVIYNKEKPILTGTIKDVFLMAHNAIHDGLTELDLFGVKKEITVANNGCRCIKFNNWTIIEQNKNNLSPYAKRAAAGERISWAVPKPEMGLNWVLITDKEIKFNF